MTALPPRASPGSEGLRRFGERIRRTPIMHFADQSVCSGTNFLAMVFVARHATPAQFGIFTIFLTAYHITVTFNRAVPHAIAMTLDWDDERARSAYFFGPPLVVGALATIVLVPTFSIIGPSFVLLPFLLVPLLLQDAVRMHAFAIQNAYVALLSDVVWLLCLLLGILFVSTAAGAASVWAIAGLCGLLVARPWAIRLRLRRRRIKTDVMSASLEFVTLAGLGYLTTLATAPIIGVAGLGALQGTAVIRGPFNLLVQALVLHRMSGPSIKPSNRVRESRRLAALIVGMTLIFVPGLILLKDVYGPPLLGSTWPAVEPLMFPVILIMLMTALALGPITIIRKMSHFKLSARVQLLLAPVLGGLPLIGAALGGPPGFLYATAISHAVLAVTFWIVLSRLNPADGLSGARI